jgi:DNA-binding response OmpR family regulator
MSVSSLVLIVDDDFHTAQLFKMIVERAGFDGLTALDAQEAIILLNEKRPALVLLDLGLPGMNGLELIKYIRAQEALSHTRILIVSAYTDMIARARRSNADDYLVKPISNTQLISKIKALLEK